MALLDFANKNLSLSKFFDLRQVCAPQFPACRAAVTFEDIYWDIDGSDVVDYVLMAFGTLERWGFDRKAQKSTSCIIDTTFLGKFKLNKMFAIRGSDGSKYLAFGAMYLSKHLGKIILYNIYTEEWKGIAEGKNMVLIRSDCPDSVAYTTRDKGQETIYKYLIEDGVTFCTPGTRYDKIKTLAIEGGYQIGINPLETARFDFWCKDAGEIVFKNKNNGTDKRVPISQDCIFQDLIILKDGVIVLLHDNDYDAILDFYTLDGDHIATDVHRVDTIFCKQNYEKTCCNNYKPTWHAALAFEHNTLMWTSISREAIRFAPKKSPHPLVPLKAYHCDEYEQ